MSVTPIVDGLILGLRFISLLINDFNDSSAGNGTWRWTGPNSEVP